VLTRANAFTTICSLGLCESPWALQSPPHPNLASFFILARLNLACFRTQLWPAAVLDKLHLCAHLYAYSFFLSKKTVVASVQQHNIAMAVVDSTPAIPVGADAAFAEFHRVRPLACSALGQLQDLSKAAQSAVHREALVDTAKYYKLQLNIRIGDALTLWHAVYGGRGSPSCVSKLHRINQDLLELTASMQAEEGEEC